MTDLATAVLVLSAVGSGLMAGLFFAFSNTVMGALGSLPDSQGAAAMQSINRVILNPAFLCAFFGAGLCHAASICLSILDTGLLDSLWEIASGLLYLGGCLLVTVVRNVPLNNRLAASGAGPSRSEAVWRHYQEHWVPWNHVRTVACLGSSLSGCIALALR